jgi:hypothetical protein
MGMQTACVVLVVENDVVRVKPIQQFCRNAVMKWLEDIPCPPAMQSLVACWGCIFSIFSHDEGACRIESTGLLEIP